ncbi:ABC-type antimicrobial peptide transport system, permease component [Chitinophaga sp. YR573]|uniref:ABC transporter permease n=1 Tax=Chitinophaga sp. YR573 TaxID=1881040 RepID=UPI0008B7754C|nr:ABC transporter permease [Chitinophaga sp. YR573]SEW44404.1 ABC-type antimicrobial peptide transport system, permease component [Chitinophaga sp. YR573]
MIRSYFRIAWRNLIKSKGYSLINIGGLAAGMAVAMLIGLWIWDELSFEKYNKNYDHIAQVMQNQNFNGDIGTWETMPYPMGDALRNDYGSYFKHVVMSSWNGGSLLITGEKKIVKNGTFMEPGAPELMGLTMLRGTYGGLKDPGSVMLSESLAKELFGETNPVGKTITFDKKNTEIVTGVYKDLPRNSVFSGIYFLRTWAAYLSIETWIKTNDNPWGNNAFRVFVQIADNADMANVSAKISRVKLDHLQAFDRRYKPVIFLHPMSKWHLYERFNNGINSGGRIQFVWLFGIIGVFVLLLACINFMNLSTARSEKRAKEVGIRKAIGSLRGQLIGQFFSESLLVVALGFILSLLLVQLALPFFNSVADKKMSILWNSPVFWLTGIVISLLTGLIAGSYPAMYLSSFQPVKVLKGTFRAGRNAAIPRKVLVVLQFTVSVTLIIGTITVFRQIQFARNRPVGYTREGLLSLQMDATIIHDHFETIKADLKSTGAVVEAAEASSPATSVWGTNGGFSWKGKDPSLAVDFPNTAVSSEYGKTVGWQFKEGRDFSPAFLTDTNAFVLNEAAVKFIGLKDPVGETIIWDDKPFKIIGVIKDMIVESPYQPVRASLYHLINQQDVNIINIKINPAAGVPEALGKIETVFKKYNPDIPFDYRFVDDEYARKFGNEERIGKLASFFAILAIFISCLGLFGMASFMAERRTKEIGVRKVMGASVFNLWQLLSKDFVVLVFISLLIAMPMAWYFMHSWLQNYQYRSEISWWIFVVAGAGILIITLLTVSFQSIKAALMNPVKSLRAE